MLGEFGFDVLKNAKKKEGSKIVFVVSHRFYEINLFMLFVTKYLFVKTW